jgi:Fe-S cluster assembly protein SufD
MIDKKFVERAMGLYQKLPQERSELYKGHFVNIPFELKNYVAAGTDTGTEKKGLANLLNNEFVGFDVKFDVAIGSIAHTQISSPFVKIKNIKDLDSRDAKVRMHHSDEDKYMAFIDAYSKDYVFVNVPNGKVAKLSVLFSNSDESLNTQVFVSVGEGARLSLSEMYTSRASSASSLGVIHEVSVGKNSEVEINAAHNENANTVVIGLCKSRVEEGAKLVFNSLYSGGSYTRVRNSFDLGGMSSRVDVNEIVVGSAEQKFDINTFMTNIGKETEANLNSRAALMDTSLCILKGFAMVKRGAAGSKSDVNQRGMMLDKGTKMYALPDMSIDENDVKATHSSATAPLDDEAVFYITSRGVAEQDVRKLIVTGFFAGELSRMSDYAMREIGMSLIREKLKNKTFGLTPKIGTADMWIKNENTSVGKHENMER